MSSVTPQMRELARRLVAGQAGASSRSAADAGRTSPLRLCEKLRPRLCTLMGKAGFSGLLARALSLSVQGAPCLLALSVLPDGTLAGVDELEIVARKKDLTEGSVVLLSQLLGLLEAFIGDTLTLQVVQEAWPKPPLDKSDSRSDSSDEASK